MTNYNGETAIERSGFDVNVKPFRPLRWIYRNLCWYGMQLERYTKKLFRLIRRLTRPTIERFRESYRSKLKQPTADSRVMIKSMGADFKKAGRTISAAAKKGGIRSFLAGCWDCATVGLSKYRTFSVSMINHVLPVICIAALLLTMFSIFSRTYVLAVECDDQLVGYVEDESTYVDATELISERVINSSDEFQNALTPTYSLVSVNRGKLNSSAEICNNILLNSDDVVEAYGFYVDDRLITATKSAGDIDYILSSFLERFRLGVENESVEFTGATKVVGGLYAAEKVVSSEQFRDIVTSKQMTTESYKVKSGDTLSRILDRNSMTEERFLELNEDFSGLREGERVTVEKEAPVLSVKSVVVSSYEKTIAYSTDTIEDSSQYIGYRKLKTKGENGKQRITIETTYMDGVQRGDPKEINRETLKEPVNEVYVVGTKKTTTTTKRSGGGSYSYTAKPNAGITGTGRFTWPLPGVNTISSKYGYRWGRLHSGIDISCGGVYGRTIVAADKGTVTTVRSSSSGYGLYLIINHGNGYSTLYAHCSSILVSAGQTVSKGQAIAKVGNSGRSTGPHLHFEIRVNGTAKNPMNWY